MTAWFALLRGQILAESDASEGFEYTVATTPPTLGQRQLAVAVIIITLTAYGAIAPFAGTPLPRIDSFIPTMMAIANRLTRAEAVVAAIAHEVSQPLAAIRLNAGAGQRFLVRAEPDVDEAKKLFEDIKGATDRASEVFESFRSLFRGGEQEHQLVNINALALLKW